jgi:SAM-dependent methyltransferase
MQAEECITPQVYEQIFEEPWVYYCERYTLLKTIGKSESISPLSLRRKVILDLNARTGYFMRMFLFEGVEKYIGIDRNSDYLEYGRSIVGGKFPTERYELYHIGTWDYLQIEQELQSNLQNNSCDVVIGSLLLLGEKEVRDIVSIFKVAHKFLKSDGKLCLTLIPYQSTHDESHSDTTIKKHSFKSQLISSSANSKLRSLTFYNKITSTESFSTSSVSFSSELLSAELTSLGFSDISIKPLSEDPRTPKSYGPDYFQEFTTESGLCSLLQATKKEI